MKTIKQIKQVVENIATDARMIPVTNDDAVMIELKAIEEQYGDLIGLIRDKYFPLFQFNIDASSMEDARAVFSHIAENVERKSFVPYLPDGQHTIDKVGSLETGKVADLLLLDENFNLKQVITEA